MIYSHLGLRNQKTDSEFQRITKLGKHKHTSYAIFECNKYFLQHFAYQQSCFFILEFLRVGFGGLMIIDT